MSADMQRFLQHPVTFHISLIILLSLSNAVGMAGNGSCYNFRLLKSPVLIDFPRDIVQYSNLHLTRNMKLTLQNYNLFAITSSTEIFHQALDQKADII